MYTIYNIYLRIATREEKQYLKFLYFPRYHAYGNTKEAGKDLPSRHSV